MLIPIEQITESSERYTFWNEKTDTGEVLPLNEKSLLTKVNKSIPASVVKGNIIDNKENLANRKALLKTFKNEPPEFAFERAIGNNDSVYSNFVELIASAKQKIGRIVVKDGNEIVSYATGFMVSDELLLTNWHVFETKDSVAQSEIQFFYELDPTGNPGKVVSFRIDALRFFYSNKQLDYCFVAVEKTDVTNTVSLSSIGYLFLNPASGKLGNQGEESLNIIHHPDGDYKQLSLRENLFIKILPTTLWYESDTSQGSSGSPVFNDQWQVVALHHMGVPATNKKGHYIDKNGKVIPIVDNKVDESRIHWIANEGIRISVILKDIFLQFPDSDIVARLKNKPEKEIISFKVTHALNSANATEKTNKETSTEGSAIQISLPSALLESTGNITIHINNKSSGIDNSQPFNNNYFNDLNVLEIKKAEVENAMDYSTCKGYQPDFLGVNIPIPTPENSIQKYVAKVKNNPSNILDYHHYSVIFHSVRKMPIISAINVDGNPNKRLDETERKDTWLRDNRLDKPIQLNDPYYEGSGFDKGHMSRREDANWGDSAADALLFANLSCMYTNACPQVKELNRSNQGGLWGKLETLLLENGIKKETGKTTKLNVFNGPIFKESDPVFRGVQVPLSFFKIILWFNAKNKLRATAFKLTQQELVSEIDFEALDFDKNIEFKTYQCSIKSLRNEVGLDFSKIQKYDTFKSSSPNESLVLNSLEELKKQL